MSSAPGWQTGELEEEWVESSPSPPRPQARAASATETLSKPDPASIRAKRGSLRSLGHSAARALPSSRSASGISNGPKVISGHGDGRVLSERWDNGVGDLIPSPPSSHSSIEDAKVGEGVPGTFLVKEGVEDDRGKHLKNWGKSKGHMFGPTALERMFQPPSPPTNFAPAAPAASTDAEASAPATTSSPLLATEAATTTPAPRRASHQYAPLNPSRLSKSVTPSTASSSTSISVNILEVTIEQETSRIEDPTVNQSLADDVTRLECPDLDDGDEPKLDASPIGGRPDYPFTFAAPVRNSSGQPQEFSPSTHDRSVSSFDSREPSHSTLHLNSSAKIPSPRRVDKGLQLFRSTYDTYTREHLSAVVDSIAIEASPSPVSAAREALMARQWSSDSSPYSGSGSGDDGSPRSGSDESDMRSSKRMRMSPETSLGHGPRPDVRNWSSQGRDFMERIEAEEEAGGPRDGNSQTDRAGYAQSNSRGASPDVHSWGAQGRALIERIKARQVDSTTSESPSMDSRISTIDSRRRDESNPSPDVHNWGAQGRALIERIKAKQVDSTTSDSRSGDWTDRSRLQHDRTASPDVHKWGAQGRALIERIKARQVDSTTSDSPSDESRRGTVNEHESPIRHQGSMSPIVPVQAMDNGQRATHKSNPSTSSSTYLRQAEDLMARIRARQSSSSQAGARSMAGSAGSRLSSEWDVAAIAASSLKLKGKGTAEGNSSRTVMGLQADIDASRKAGVSSDGEDEPISSSARRRKAARRPTAAAVFNGGEAAGPSNMRMIRPDDVAGMVPQQLGRMRYDPELMRWVKEAPGRTAEGTEARSNSRSRSAESEDVFAGMESWGRHSTKNTPSQQQQPPLQTVIDSASSESDTSDDEGMIRQADQTHIIDNDGSDSESDQSLQQEDETAHQQPLVQLSPPKVSPPHRPMPHHAASAPAIMTPQPASNGVKPIRSALRNANGGSLTPGVTKKRTAWHESVTPAPGSERRSVSFSDGKKHGRMRDLHEDRHESTEEAGDGDWFQSGEGRSFLPSARTKRIGGLLDDMADLSLDDGTPSKPPRSMVASPEQSLLDLTDTVDPDMTARPGHSFRAKANANATFLTECSFGVAHDQLVHLITEVYGSEPYWDELKALDLRGKGAESVVRLKEFLPQLEHANLNNNKLSYLSGIPNTVRTLHVAGNRLSSLTSVDYLRNLQFLDISSNKLDSVQQLSCLKHLRELRANNNSINSLEGVLDLDGLVKLSVSGNKISKVDLIISQWTQLEELDVSSNLLTDVVGLERLSALRTLILESNDLTTLVPSRPMTKLRTLRMSDNSVTTIDLALFPKIRTLYADRNRLCGLARSGGGQSRIENLSLRNQQVKGLSISAKELDSVKRLYVSGNPLSSDFFPTGPLYSLIYVEAAACNLRKWPERFVQRLPNVKILNLNYNYFENLDGLKGMKGLRKLTMVGARLGGSGAKGVVSGLRDHVELEEVDLRMNPTTLGFYLPLMLPSTSPVISISGDESPPLKQNPLPSVTLASFTHHSFPKEAETPAHVWAKLDVQFRKALPDEWYSKRLVYRGLIMANCPRLQSLDGVRVDEREKRKAERLLNVVTAA